MSLSEGSAVYCFNYWYSETCSTVITLHSVRLGDKTAYWPRNQWRSRNQTRPNGIACIVARSRSSTISSLCGAEGGEFYCLTTCDNFPRLHLPRDTSPVLHRRMINPSMGTSNRRATDHYTAVRWFTNHRTAAAPPSSLFAVTNVTAHPSTASVPTSYYSKWHYNYLCTLKG